MSIGGLQKDVVHDDKHHPFDEETKGKRKREPGPRSGRGDGGKGLLDVVP